MNLERRTGNEERGTKNGERRTGNEERGTKNGERRTGNDEPGTTNLRTSTQHVERRTENALLGLDLGGTKIAAVVLAPDGAERWAHRVPTPRHDYDGTLRALRDLVALGEAAVGAECSVGIGMPGAISPATGVVKNANSTWLNGRRFHEDVEHVLGRPVRLANDANCLALSEAADGAAQGAAVVFAAIVGTGTGGGIAVNGSVLAGANAIAGEWGHNALPWPDPDELPGPPCYCGRRGCIETWLSGPGLSADHERRSGEARPADVLLALAADGDSTASATLRAWQRRLARSLASVINVLDPDVIVAGGGLSQVPSIYTEIPRLWTEWVFSDRIATRFVPAQHGDASGVRGAARLWNG